MELSLFNVHDGYLEGIVRGLRGSFLTREDYKRLANADTLEDLRTALEETDYGYFMQDEPLPLAIPTIAQRARGKLTAEFKYLQSQAYQPLGKFLDYIAADKMVDNMVGLIQGALNRKPAEELLARSDPLGYFSEMRAIAQMDFSASYEELYRSLLVDTPVGRYFEVFLANSAAHATGEEGGHTMQQVEHIMTEADIDLLRNSLKKGWLEDFYGFVQTLEDSTTREVMTHILKASAACSFLFPCIRVLPRAAVSRLPQEQQDSQLPFPLSYSFRLLPTASVPNGLVLCCILLQRYLNVYDQCRAFYIGDEREKADLTARFKSLEDLLYREMVHMCEMAFEQQFHYGARNQKHRMDSGNGESLAETEAAANGGGDVPVIYKSPSFAVAMPSQILMKRKEHIDSIVPLFEPRI
ncbi:vacuolar atp synthase subunit [Cyclospora cayetanensis]|uniref:Vacuolar atp synthase subunit n=1 Tax=Cyclospora cayetanensis TaxID=88456 RepID=A0A1D3CY16_9EIME|nr:vacuolar atp synthase subunit [Cyclospora cayetanensis]